jgi:hypothetical protein
MLLSQPSDNSSISLFQPGIYEIQFVDLLSKPQQTIEVLLNNNIVHTHAAKTSLQVNFTCYVAVQ